MDNKPESRQAALAQGGVPAKRKARRAILFPDHEWALIRERASYYGIGPGLYVVMCWRAFELSGMPFRLEMPLPVEPWDPQKKVG